MIMLLNTLLNNPITFVKGFPAPESPAQTQVMNKSNNKVIPSVNENKIWRPRMQSVLVVVHVSMVYRFSTKEPGYSTEHCI